MLFSLTPSSPSWMPSGKSTSGGPSPSVSKKMPGTPGAATAPPSSMRTGSTGSMTIGGTGSWVEPVVTIN